MFPKQNTRYICSILMACASLMFFLAGGVYAESIHDITGSISPSDLYDASQQEWHISSPYMTLGTINGDAGSMWHISPFGSAQFDWSGSYLQDDMSGGGQADGLFLAGGRLTITGEVWDLINFTPLTTGPTLLLDAYVTAFRIQDYTNNNELINRPYPDGPNPNPYIRLRIFPKDGWLTDNGVMEMAPGGYFFDFQASNCMNDGPVESFQTDIHTAAGSQWTMTIPEPAALLLMIGGLPFIVVRRRR